MAIKQHLGIDGTLLGVDAVLDQKLIKKDASEAELMELIKAHDGPVRLLLTPIGGQGILFGRGNHTVCHQVIDYLGMANTTVLASKSKLKSLNGRPLRLDTGDTELDQRLSGYIPIITGYDDQVIYQLAAL
jgi:predicted polyphosphate/ATP-dependent NAD kinase